MVKTLSTIRPTYAEISGENFINNYLYLEKKNQHSFFCPMLKTDAYGHDDTKILSLCRRLKTRWLGVATIDEGIHIRKEGYCENIIVFSPDYKNTNDLLHKYNLTPVIGDLHHLSQIKNIRVHLKINTGMNRMGLKEDEIEKAKILIKDQNLELEGILSHLLNGQDIDDPNGFSVLQRNRFKDIISNCNLNHVPIQHLYNSNALILKEGQSDYGSRPGISLYGYSERDNENLKPVMRLRTKIIKILEIKKGESVSYGPTFTAQEDALVGVLPIGYGDGLRRTLSNQVSFRCRDKLIQQIGNICMDYSMVELSSIRDEVQLYDDVFIFGQDKNDLKKQAATLGTIVYDLLTSITARVPKVLVERFQ